VSKSNSLKSVSIFENINKNKETIRKIKEKNLEEENKYLYDRIKNM
jgi:hypothetical protein